MKPLMNPPAWQIEGAGNHRIAELPNADPDVLHNGRLIVAAPDLLEACRKAKQALIDIENCRWNPCPVHEVLDAAIAKAEGK